VIFPSTRHREGVRAQCGLGVVNMGHAWSVRCARLALKTPFVALWLIDDSISLPSVLCGGTLVADHAIDEVFIGPDDHPARRAVLVGHQERPEPSDALLLHALRPGARRTLKAGLWMAARLPVDDTPALETGEATTGGVRPTAAQWERYFDEDPGTPPLMLNLLSYRDKAAYQRYSRVAVRYVLAGGGEIVLMRPVARGPDGTRPWDEVAIVRYPSRAAFGHMTSRQGYQDAIPHRDEGLERTALFVLR
jgi:uncharacterized protein (DUF1330 family)